MGKLKCVAVCCIALGIPSYVVLMMWMIFYNQSPLAGMFLGTLPLGCVAATAFWWDFVRDNR